MIQLQRNVGSPDADGYLKLEGNPDELKPGDIVLDGKYAVMKTSPGNHNGSPATQVTLAETEEYIYTAGMGLEAVERGRVVLANESWLKFERQVREMDFGVEPEIHYELLDDTGFESYTTEWRGPCKELPKGLLVAIGEKGESKLVDTAYPNGAVVFSDGTLFQSHPDREWIGWLDQPRMSTSYEH